jgi:hypothetical protein
MRRLSAAERAKRAQRQRGQLALAFDGPGPNPQNTTALAPRKGAAAAGKEPSTELAGAATGPLPRPVAIPEAAFATTTGPGTAGLSTAPASPADDECYVPATLQECRTPLQGRWLDFHRRNPLIGSLFLGRAERLLQEGIEAARREGRDPAKVRLGAKDIFEDLRREAKVRRNESDLFKLNNDYTALYARWAMQQMPRLRGRFETRSRKT